MKLWQVLGTSGIIFIFLVLESSGLDFGICEKNVTRNYLNHTASPPRNHKIQITIRECCMGFHTVGKKCIPMCNNVCVNSRCIGNNKCQCHSGYYAVDDFRCLPKCEPACGLNMACLAPGRCLCKPEFKKVNETSCEPVCSFTADNFECINADCVAPNDCECHEGFRKVSEFQCDPVCSKCENGDCVSPEVCECYEGFGKGHDGSCEPICDPECTNGKCIAPNTCECNESYEKHLNSHECLERHVIKDRQSCLISCHNGTCSDNGACICNAGFEMFNGKCLLMCNKTCGVGGKCLENQCVCDDGYRLNENSTTCAPVCAFEDDHDCINGVCVAPQTCQCFDGYHLLPTKNCTCVLMCDPPCINGICTEDGCICHNNFYNISGHECAKHCPAGFKWMYDECFEEIDFLDSPEHDSTDDDDDGIENTTELIASSEEFSFDFTETTTDRDSSDEGSSDSDDDEYDEQNSGKSTSTIPPVIVDDRSDDVAVAVEKSLISQIVPFNVLMIFVSIIVLLIICILATFCVLHKRFNSKNIYYVQDQEKSSNCVYFTSAQNEPEAMRELECSSL